MEERDLAKEPLTRLDQGKAAIREFVVHQRTAEEKRTGRLSSINSTSAIRYPNRLIAWVCRQDDVDLLGFLHGFKSWIIPQS